MIPTKPIVLKGKSAKAFEKYQNRPATKNEIAFFKSAETFYLKHCPTSEPKISAKRRK